MKCFKCENKAKFIIKNFWLGMSYITEAPACDIHKEKIVKSVRRFDIDVDYIINNNILIG